MNCWVWRLTGVGVDYLHLKRTEIMLALAAVDPGSTV